MEKVTGSNSSILSFYDEEDIQEMQDLEKVNLVLQKYIIGQTDNELINSAEKNTLQIINYISDLSKKELSVQRDLLELFNNNFTFIKQINIYLKRKLSNLTNSDSTYFFKDLSIMFKIFSISTSFKIFNSYNDYNFKDLSSLLREIENDLIKLSNERESLFEIKFDSYVILLEALTQLCFINSTDNERKKTISTFLDLMQESMNILKFNTTLDEDHLEILNHIQGTHLYYFIEENRIDIQKDSLEKSFSKLYYQIEKLEDGYLLSKNQNFGNSKNFKSENQEFLIFKSNSSLVFLDLLHKLEINNISFEEFQELDSFKKVLKIYGENFHYEFNENYMLESLDNFKNRLLDSLIYEYKINEDFTKVVNHNTILSDFIFSDKNFENINLKTIYLILLYSKNIESFKYLHIGQILAKSKKINNDYYEHYKLKIFSLIISYFSNEKFNYESNELLELIKHYIDENKISSHLFELYSQVYLSLALYYVNDYSTIKKANKNYFTYLYTNNKNLLETTHNKINENYLTKIAKYYLKELNLKEETYNKESLLEFSQNMLKKYIENEELELKLHINESLSNLSNDILNNPLWEFRNIERQLTSIIQNKLFGGLCKVYILGIENEQKEPEDIGYHHYNLELDNTHALRFIYPIMNEDKFNSILNKNRIFLITNVNNILKTLKQNDKQLIDYMSGLYNVDKLKESIKNSTDSKIGLIQIFVKSLNEINNTYGFEKGNEVFKIICAEIRNIAKNQIGTYKLEGQKIAIMLANKNESQEIIEKIKDLVIKYQNDYIKVESYISYTEDRKEKILFSSSKSMDEAFMREINRKN